MVIWQNNAINLFNYSSRSKDEPLVSINRIEALENSERNEYNNSYPNDQIDAENLNRSLTFALFDIFFLFLNFRLVEISFAS